MNLIYPFYPILHSFNIDSKYFNTWRKKAYNPPIQYILLRILKRNGFMKMKRDELDRKTKN